MVSRLVVVDGGTSHYHTLNRLNLNKFNCFKTLIQATRLTLIVCCITPYIFSTVQV